MKASWHGNTGSVANKDHAQSLAEAGVFDEAEALFDAVERGENPFATYEDPLKLVETIRQLRPA